jgi:hypothetical protein
VSPGSSFPSIPGSKRPRKELRKAKPIPSRVELGAEPAAMPTVAGHPQVVASGYRRDKPPPATSPVMAERVSPTDLLRLADATPLTSSIVTPSSSDRAPWSTDDPQSIVLLPQHQRACSGENPSCALYCIFLLAQVLVIILSCCRLSFFYLNSAGQKLALATACRTSTDAGRAVACNWWWHACFPVDPTGRINKLVFHGRIYSFLLAWCEHGIMLTSCIFFFP